MERSDSSRKRVRDERKEQKKGLNDKNLGTVFDYSSDDEESYASHRQDEFGIFEFPWLKEGKLSGFDKLMEPHDSLIGILEACEASNNAAAEIDKSACMQQDSLLQRQDFLDCKFDAGGALPPVKIDDLYPLDSVINEPVDACMNKAKNLG